MRSELRGLSFMPGFRPQDLAAGPKEPASFGVHVGPYTHTFQPSEPCPECERADDLDVLCQCRCHEMQPTLTIQQFPAPCPGRACLLFGQDHQHTRSER